MKFLKFFMYVCAVLAFLSFFVMMAGTGEGEGAKLIMLIGLLAFVFFAAAAQMLNNHIEWKEKQREREAVKRYLKEKGI